MSDNYLIIGDDKYLRGKEAVKIKDKFLSADEIELNYSAYGPEDLDGVMDSLGTMPFLADKRVVLVKDAQQISGDFAETILSYLEKPSDTSVLALSFDKSYKKNKYYKKLSSLMTVVESNSPTPLTAKNWIRAFFKKEDIDISPDAVDLIVELKGQDTRAIKEELDKLAGYSGGERIETRHVEIIVGRSVMETVFKLVDAINAGDADLAFRVLGDLEEQKKQPQEVLGYLGWYLRTMQKITLLTAKGAATGTIASELGYSSAYVQRLISQARKYTPEKLKRCVALLFETDRDLKTGRKPPRLALEMLVVSFLKK